MKNIDKLLDKYGDRILAIYHHDDQWKIVCWHAGPKVSVKGKTLAEALQSLDRLVRACDSTLSFQQCRAEIFNGQEWD